MTGLAFLAGMLTGLVLAFVAVYSLLVMQQGKPPINHDYGPVA